MQFIFIEVRCIGNVIVLLFITLICNKCKKENINLTTIEMCHRVLTCNDLNCQSDTNHIRHHTIKLICSFESLQISCRCVTDLLGSRCSWSPDICRSHSRDQRYEQHLCLSHTPSCHHTFRNESKSLFSAQSKRTGKVK